MSSSPRSHGGSQCTWHIRRPSSSRPSSSWPRSCSNATGGARRSEGRPRPSMSCAGPKRNRPAHETPCAPGRCCLPARARARPRPLRLGPGSDAGRSRHRHRNRPAGLRVATRRLDGLVSDRPQGQRPSERRDPPQVSRSEPRRVPDAAGRRDLQVAPRQRPPPAEHRRRRPRALLWRGADRAHDVLSLPSRLPRPQRGASRSEHRPELSPEEPDRRGDRGQGEQAGPLACDAGRPLLGGAGLQGGRVVARACARRRSQRREPCPEPLLSTEASGSPLPRQDALLPGARHEHGRHLRLPPRQGHRAHLSERAQAQRAVQGSGDRDARASARHVHGEGQRPRNLACAPGRRLARTGSGAEGHLLARPGARRRRPCRHRDRPAGRASAAPAPPAPAALSDAPPRRARQGDRPADAGGRRRHRAVGMSPRSLPVRLAAVVAAGVLVGVPAAHGQARDPTPLYAYYYIWFNASSWNRAKTDYPLLGRYTSDEQTIMSQHIRLAKQAGIDGFIVSWKSTPVLDARLRKLEAVAQRERFKLAVIYQGLDYERRPLPVEKVASDFDLFIREYGGSVVFSGFGKPVMIWSGTWEFTPKEVERVASTSRGKLKILASERTPGDYEQKASSFDGDAYYWSSVNPETFPDYAAKLQEMSRAVHAHGGLWFAPAAPGFDARHLGGKTVVERKDGDTLRRELETAQSSEPDAVGLISWNEFSEN